MMGDKCELCGDTYHEGWDDRMDQFGMVCPGAHAGEREREIYIRAVTAGYLKLLTEIDHYKDTIEDRKRLWYERTRSDATQEELQADCDQRVQEVGERVPVEPSELIIDLSDVIDPPHLTVPGEVPTRSGLIQVHEKDRTEPEDAALFVDPPEGPPPVGPAHLDQGDDHPLDGYWHK